MTRASHTPKVADSYELNRASKEAEARALCARLQPSEREVLRLIAYGMSLKEIGTELGVSRFTAKSHAMHISIKTGIHGRGGHVRLALRAGLASLWAERP